ncbi:TRAP transporter large permease [Helicobacter apodemus]|uniref:C4-dicarboxylate ABC transporter n=1 Tax=Helicobacter apodemus TaxID=135569 RepID=A0A2U8FEL0_9HELI|nr:TRAP transporter large permease subunit [Helicobacter apodemus]AWI34257.1 C4-dicarboxylate ABC transporter [Helicobacter apodemus]
MELFALIISSIILLILGVPVAFAFGSSGLIVGSYLVFFENNPYILSFLPNRLEGIFNNTTLMSIPLFILMGMILERSGIAERLIGSIAKFFGSLGGGAAIGVIIVGALLAASTGIVGATVVMMGVIAVPVMVKAQYNKSFLSGVVAASGTLGQIVPPSIILIILADVLQLSVRDLFAAAILPSILLIGAYIFFVLGVVFFLPHFAPASEDSSNIKSLALETLKAVIPPIVLIILVLGSILGGLIEPTAAAALGVIGALILALLQGRLDLNLLHIAGRETILFCGMVFAILIGANCFTLVFNTLGGDSIILEFFLVYLDSPLYFVLVAMLVIFILGFFIDFFEICYIILPILAGIAMHYQINMLWFALLVAINLQTSFLTPPFGFSIFFLKSAVGECIKINAIYKGVLPFILLQLLILAVMFLFPNLTLNSEDWGKILQFIF